MPETCRFCDGPPDDWCPGCGSLLCERHSESHEGSYERPCRDAGVEIPLQPWCGT